MNPPDAVPFIDLRRFEDGFLAAWTARAADIGAHARFVGGPEVARLEARLAAESGAAAVVGCANGTDALQLALRAVGVGPGDLVVMPDATFWATLEAAVNVGARVVTVDVDEDDLQMDFEAFVAAVERHRPRAAILVHLYGWGSARLIQARGSTGSPSFRISKYSAVCASPPESPTCAITSPGATQSPTSLSSASL